MRSGSNKCPVCTVKVKLCEHHINGRKVPMANDPWNIVWLCPNCHDMVHAKDIIIEAWFKTTTGRELIWHLSGEDSITGEDSTPPTYGGN